MPDDHPGYRVAYHDKAKSMISEVAAQLLAEGWTHDAIESLLIQVETRLRDAPQDFGEPLHGIRGTDLTVFIGFVRPISVQFSVDEHRRLVHVRKMDLMKSPSA